jgi:zinc transporter 2
VAVLVNVLMYGILHSGHGHTHGGAGGHQHLDSQEDRPAAGGQINIRATSLHILGDFLSSLGVLLSSILIACIGEPAKLADPICTLLFAVIVLCTTIPVFRDTLLILAEGKPADLDYDGVLNDLQGVEGVVQVHCTAL